MQGKPRTFRATPRGQVLVIVALGMVVLVAMVGVVIDGGYAWGRQRDTQNAADSMSKAGARVIQDYLLGLPATDSDVGCAVEASAAANAVDLTMAVYTDYLGDDLIPSLNVGACGAGGTIPLDAQGVRATGAQTFDTFLARVIGFSEFTATADATSVVGELTGICAASAGCGVLPVTYPRSLDTCDGTNSRVIGEGDWQFLPPPTVLDDTNLAIMPLCSNGPGSVGWLDFDGCPNNLADVITDPCNVYIPIESWEQTSTGNVNNLEDELRDFVGPNPGTADEDDMVLFIPIFDFTCDQDIADDRPIQDCPSYPNVSGNGSNLWYHIPYWGGFKLDGAFTGGNDPECDLPPGEPPAGGNGATGCLKGWFVQQVPAGGSIGVAPINPGDPLATGILLIE
jgi:hypothetical protein